MRWAGRIESTLILLLGTTTEVRTLCLLSQTLVPGAFQLHGLQLGQLVPQLLVVHQGLLLLFPLLLQLCLQSVYLTLQL